MKHCALVLLLLVAAACGSTPPPSSEPRNIAAIPAPAPPLGPALDALMAAPYCEPDACVDPFPIASIRRWDARGDRVAFAGPGAIVGVYEHGAWDLAPLPGSSPAHDVAFAPDGTLFAIDPDTLFRRDGGGWVVAAHAQGASTLSALLARARDDVWIATTGGSVLRFVRDAIAPMDPAPRSRGIDRIWESDGTIAVRGPFNAALFDGTRWQTSLDAAQGEAFEEATGCGASSLAEQLFDEDVLYPDRGSEAESDASEEASDEASEEEYVEERAHIPPPISLPAEPDRSPSGWIASVDPERRARFGRWIERAPADVADLARRGESWVAVGVADEHGALWGRIDGVLVSRDLPLAHPVAVALAGPVVVVAGEDGTIARVDASGVAPAVLRVPASAPLVDVLGRADGSAIVLAEDGDVLAIDTSGNAALLHHIGRAMRGIDGDDRTWIAVGEAGAIARGDDGAWSMLDAHSTVDLFAVRMDGDRAFAAGAAGTIVRIEGSSATVLPRVTDEAFVDVHAAGDVMLALSTSGAVVRVEGTSWGRRMRGIRGDVPGLELVQWAPRDEGPWAAITDRLDVRLDEPGAVMPYHMVALHPRPYAYRPPEHDELIGLAIESELDYELREGEMFCCGGDGDDGRATLADAASCADDPAFPYCSLDAEPELAVDTRARLRLRMVEVGEEDGQRCAPIRFEVVRLTDGRVERVSPVMGCEHGRDERDRAAWRFLAEPAQQAFSMWEPIYERELGAPPRSDLVLHRTATADSLLFVSRDNATATRWVTIRRPPGQAPVDAWAPIIEVRRSPDGSLVVVGADIVSAGRTERFLWIGARPRLPAPSTTGEREPRDVAQCEQLYVLDADGETNLRALPTSRADVVGVVPNGTPLRVRARHGSWIRAADPDGWVFRDNVRCAE